MFRNLLVPLDGSRHAEQALPVAARLAQASQGTITLLQVIDLAPDTASADMQVTPERRATHSASYLEQVRQRPYLSRLVCRTEVVSGNAATVIAEMASRTPIDLIVLATHRHTGVRHWLLGSVAEHLARFAPVPVLVLQDQKPLRIHKSIDGTSFVRALVPLDDSQGSLAAVAPAAQLVSAFSAPGLGEIHLAHIVVSPATEPMAALETRLDLARQRLNTLGLRLRENLKTSGNPLIPPPLLTWAVTMEHKIAEGIARRAEHGEKHADTRSGHHCDVIVMATRHSTDQQKWAEGSITEQVLRITHLPVLIARPLEGSTEVAQPQVGVAHGASV